MDCFFAAVALRNFPQYRDKPVAISHGGKQHRNANVPSSSTAAPVSSAGVNVTKDSTSECATCNYEARRFGITKGMFLGTAKELCPSLIILNYDFDGYKEVAEQVADILFRVAGEYQGSVEQVSCDEAYMELYIAEEDSRSAHQIAENVADAVRKEIFDETQCTASIGVADNKLLAKLGTDRVKPNGSFVVRDYREVLAPLQLRDLHGVGYRLEKKLAEAGLTKVQDIWDLGTSAEKDLITILGAATGKKIYSYCQGRDDRPVAPAERKTIGAECNYGVRFNGEYGVDYMISGLAKEVQKRMTIVGIEGASKITLKIKQRAEGAPSPGKFLGHGMCNNLSRSRDIRQGTRDWTVISKIGYSLFTEMGVRPDDVRGMGIVLSKLSSESTVSKSAGVESKQTLDSWISGAVLPARKKPSTKPAESDRSSLTEHHVSPPAQDDDLELDIALPPLSQIRMSQVEELPSPMRRKIKKEIAIASLRSKVESPPDGKPQARFRQTNIKRMLRLEAVKSGLETLPEGVQQVSLTQLERLPLEVQLNVANNDEARIGTLCPPVQKSRKKRKATATEPRKSMRWSKNLPGSREDSGRIKGRRAVVTVDLAPYSEDPRDFYRENIDPLRQFLDKHPKADREAMDEVKNFLLVCVEENRLPDVVLLLRNIKNRRDVWSGDPCNWLLDQVNEAVSLGHGGARLESDWVFLNTAAQNGAYLKYCW